MVVESSPTTTLLEPTFRIVPLRTLCVVLSYAAPVAGFRQYRDRLRRVIEIERTSAVAWESVSADIVAGTGIDMVVVGKPVGLAAEGLSTCNKTRRPSSVTQSAGTLLRPDPSERTISVPLASRCTG
jgi:hypothetical protein